MGKATFKRNGTPPREPRFAKAQLPVATLSVLLSGFLLAGCSTIPTTATTTSAQCAAWRAITYSSGKDTAPTVKQIRTHNKVGQKLGCWK